MNFTVAHIAILALATWRIASLFVREKGPFGVFIAIRKWAGIEHDTSGTPWMIPDEFLAQLLGCVWCFSLWTASGVTIVYFFFPEIAILLALPFALSAGAILLDTHLQKSR